MSKEDDKSEFRQLRDLIYTFMYFCNKPVIISEIVLQFKSYKRSLIEKVLDDLAAKEMISLKLFGKSKIYCLSQKMEFEINEEEYTEEIDAEQDSKIEDKCLRYLKWNYERNSSKLKAAKEENKQLTDEIQSNENELSVEELKRAVSDMKSTVKDYENNEDKEITVSCDDFNKVKNKHQKLKKDLTERNLIYKNIVENISEALNLKRKQFLNTVGIDEE